MSQSKLAELATELCLSLDPRLEFDRVWLNSTKDWVLQEIQTDTHGGTRREWQDVSGKLFGLEATARIKIQLDIADALSKVSRDLDTRRTQIGDEWEDNLPVKMTNLPSHIQLLLNLASKPTSTTVAFAQDLLDRKPSEGPTPDQLLYNEIMSKPFSGSHWGNGYDEEVRDGWTDSESEGTMSSDEEILTPNSKASVPNRHLAKRLEKNQARLVSEKLLDDAKEYLSRKRKAAYWRTGGAEVVKEQEGVNGWRDVLTRTSALSLSIQRDRPLLKVISVNQLQRELLYALHGQPGVFFEFDEQGSCAIQPKHPHVAQMSERSLESFLAAFQQNASKLFTCRLFARSAGTASNPVAPLDLKTRPGFRQHRTTQAFAEGIRHILSTISLWVAQLEQDLVIGIQETSKRTVTTPLQLKLVFEEEYGFLLDHLTALIPLSDEPVILLDTLYTTLTSLPPTTRQEDVILLRQLFIDSAEPMWALLRIWLFDGMPIPAALIDHESQQPDIEEALDDEFWIKKDKDVAWADEDFWEAGYVEGKHGWPNWLESGDLKELIIEAGKARGMLKGLLDTDQTITGWKSLRELLGGCEKGGNKVVKAQTAGFDEEIYNFAAPICAISTFQLRRALEEDCGMLQHLDAIEGLLYMQGFDVMEDWRKWLFFKMKEDQRWSDFHIITSNIRDAIENNNAQWMNSSAVRIRTIRSPGVEIGIACIRADYQVPFPLSQLFTPTSMEYRSDVFTFLLQLAYARSHMTELSLIQSRISACNATSEDKVLRRIFHKLSWLLNTIWCWITERVITVQIRAYRDQLASTISLRAMINLELQHTRSIRNFCFQHQHTADGLEALNEIFDIAGGIKSLLPHLETDQNAAGMVYEDNLNGEHKLGKLRDLSRTIDERVDILRHAVEALATTGDTWGAANGNDARESWTMLSFALQDWK